jgi:hypothetical protein
MAKKKEGGDPFWLFIFGILFLIIILAIVDRARVTAIIAIVILIMSLTFYKFERK